MPDFANDEPVYCPLTYTVEIPSSAPWITQTATKTLSWQTNDNSYSSATYEIKIIAESPDGG